MQSPQYQCTYQIWWKTIEIYSSYCPGSKIWMYCGQITQSKIENLPISNLKADLHNINAMHIPSLMKNHWYILKLSSRNENMDMLRTDNCQKLTKFAHQQSQTRSSQYQCTHQVWWKSTDIYSSYHLEMKIQTDLYQMDGWTDRHTDSQRDTIIPRHYHEAGYKNGILTSQYPQLLWSKK